MLGTIVNTATIIVGSLLGGVIRKAIKEQYVQTLYNALGLCVVTLGAYTAISHLPDSHYPVMFILSMAVGGIVGTVLGLDRRVSRLTEKEDHHNYRPNGLKLDANLIKGLTTGILLYCIGTLSMVGPMNSALYGDNTFLYTNATLDLVTSCILASTYGVGMIIAAPVLFCWQGSIYCLTLFASKYISPALLTEISIVGGVLILSTGLNILNIKNCKTLNLIPALFMPPVFFLILKLLAIL